MTGADDKVAWEGSAGVPRAWGPSVVTLGNFDGVHVGHQALIAAARRLAGPDGQVAVLTFDPSPRDVLQPDHGVPAVQAGVDRVRRLLDRGVDRVVVEPFTRALSRWTADEFASEILGRRLRASGVVVGWDFRFGAQRAGDAALLRRVLGVPVEEVGAVEVDGAAVSSTRVRDVVRAGDLALATRLLGCAHELVGPVVHGDARGRTIGVPTANVAVRTPLRPPDGVYAVRATSGGRSWDGVANLGGRPTVGDGAAPLEVHLLDADVDLYGQELVVGLVARLRGQRRFDGLDALRAQIAGDIVAAREVLR